jgi:hypothetical protein
MLQKKKERDEKNEKREDQCIRCKKEVETQEHVWECEERKQEKKKIMREIYKVIKREYKEIKMEKVEEGVKNQIKEIIEENKMGVRWSEIISGIVLKVLEEWIRENKIKKGEEVIYRIMNIAEKGFRDIWCDGEK